MHYSKCGSDVESQATTDLRTVLLQFPGSARVSCIGFGGSPKRLFPASCRKLRAGSLRCPEKRHVKL
ncbi:MAG: hypothetical protein DME44_06860 [Verrucomicrobia bacterium]|nr:MAG: hypothetical protein DME44_06860 [Verrucomicrobiota bacterium]